MAISFGRALLAGAAGVAEYSNEEQRRRQLRLNRVQELQDRLQVENAKSKYAARYNQWERNKQIKAQLGNTDINTAAGQVHLGSILTGKKFEEVALLAKGGARWEMPKDMEEPIFEMPQFSGIKKASSPIEDWVNGYRGSDKPESIEQKGKEALEEIYGQQLASQFQEVPMADERPAQAPQTLGPSPELQALADGKVEGTMEPLGASDTSENGSLQPLGGMEQRKALGGGVTFDSFIAKPKKEFNSHWSKSVDGKGKESDVLYMTDKNTGETKVVRFPTGKKPYAKLDPVVTVNEDGSETIQEQYVAKDNLDVVLGGRTYTVNTELSQGLTPGQLADNMKPLKLVSDETLADYMFEGDSKKQPGQMVADWDPSELEAIDNAANDTFFGIQTQGDDTIPDAQAFKTRLMKEYLNARNAELQDGMFTSDDLVSGGKEAYEDYIKANAWISTARDMETLIKLVKAKAVDPMIFDTPEGDNSDIIKAVREQLTNEDLFKEYKESSFLNFLPEPKEED